VHGPPAGQALAGVVLEQQGARRRQLASQVGGDLVAEGSTPRQRRLSARRGARQLP